MVGCSAGEFSVRGSLGAWCGGGGLVLLATHPHHDAPLALKRIYLDRDRHNAALIQDEILTTRQLQHPNILPYYDTFVSGLYLYIVTPLMNFGSCRDLINKYYNEGLPEQACCIILHDTLLGLEYIHKKGYIHRGIRSSHVLLCSSGKVCLGGLRSAASLLHQGKRQKSLHALPPPGGHENTSLLWLSPELLEQNLRGYDEKSDVYSIGMLACELANGIIPFSGVPTTLMLTEKVRGNAPQLLDCTTFHKVMQIPNNHEESEMNDLENVPGGSAQCVTQEYATRRFNNAFHLFATTCLEREPSLRPTCSQLLNNTFFKQINKTDSLAQILYEAQSIENEAVDDDLSEHILEEKLSDMDIHNPCEWDF